MVMIRPGLYSQECDLINYTDRAFTQQSLDIIKNDMGSMLEQHLFEPNDEMTRTHISNQMNSYLDTLRDRSGINDYKVICDDTNNTPTDIDDRIMNVDVFIQPHLAADFIQLQSTINNQGAGFSDTPQVEVLADPVPEHFFRMD